MRFTWECSSETVDLCPPANGVFSPVCAREEKGDVTWFRNPSAVRYHNCHFNKDFRLDFDYEASWFAPEDCIPAQYYPNSEDANFEDDDDDDQD
uniref:Uncharacterized protein n=1 Tax=Timema shepardi TaxID=629360 RepID=A0A7R9B458_TIMSH|nr:unnamed protein product [Timema shepardi]